MNRAAVARPLRLFGWFWVVFSIAVLFVFGGIRLLDMFEPGMTTDPFAVRYRNHPWSSFIHIAPGLVYLALAPFQFIPAIRRHFPRVHRVMGRILVGLGLISGLFAVVIALLLPAFAGLPTLSATLVFGFLFCLALIKGFLAARKRQFAVHREWMIRALALGLGVATIRAVIGLSQGLTGMEFEAVFGYAFWIGLGINAVVAELWIRWTRGRVRI